MLSSTEYRAVLRGGGTPGTVPGGPLRIWGPSFFKAHFLIKEILIKNCTILILLY